MILKFQMSFFCKDFSKTFILVDSNKGPSLVDLAASSAGIDLKSEAANNQVQLQNFTEQKEQKHVQSHHAYPSPFSQVYFHKF